MSSQMLKSMLFFKKYWLIWGNCTFFQISEQCMAIQLVRESCQFPIALDNEFRNSRSLSLKPPESWIMMALDKKRTQFISFSAKELLLSTYVYENLNNPIWWCDFSCGHILLQICKVGTLLLSTHIPCQFQWLSNKSIFAFAL